MANSALEIAAMCVSLLGLIGAAASTGMPMWRVTAFIGENIIVMETRWEGLWMNCYRQANIRMQCKVYDSLLALSPDLQAARGLMCCSLALGGLGVLIAIAGMKCTACIQGNDRAKRVVLIIAGSMIIMACICVIIPVSWTGHVIIRDFYNPLLLDAQRRELGEALYIGWVSAALLFVGGCMFACCNIPQEKGSSERPLYSRNSQYMAYAPQMAYTPQAAYTPQTVYTPQRYPSSHGYPSRQPSMRKIVAMCLGLVGLIGASATTGLPMWKVTAFIGENIIVMETRWEGLWMNCYRQANIRMQCKVYDSLLILPPDLQAARGLMCCSLALSGVGLLIALAGMRCISCMQDRPRLRSIVLITAGGLLLLASLCVFIPVSWTGHVIIRDFYNPLLLDAQRRELGEALYIGWVTGGFLFASALILICRHVPQDSGSFDMYHPQNPTLIGYLSQPHKPALIGYQPVVNTPSFVGNRSSLHSSYQLNHSTPLSQRPSALLNTSYTQSQPMVSNGGSFAGHHPPSAISSTFMGNLSTPGNSLYISHPTAPFIPSNTGHQSTTYNSVSTGFHPVRQNPVFIGYHSSIVEPQSSS
ncbi:hypothetical protein JZ751_002169, partial [Albula glossodonta]